MCGDNIGNFRGMIGLLVAYIVTTSDIHLIINHLTKCEIPKIETEFTHARGSTHMPKGAMMWI
jgi:hypothetical protein